MRTTWTWHFDLPPEQLWPVLADTSRLNEAMGLPAYVLEETAQANGTVLRRGRTRLAGYAFEWEERPFEWIQGQHFRQDRLFDRGPFGRVGSAFQVEHDGQGARVTCTIDLEPRLLVGRLIAAAFARHAAAGLHKRIGQAVDFMKGERLSRFDLPSPRLPAGARDRAAGLADAIDRSVYGNGLGRRLGDYVLQGMAGDLVRLRPKLLAREFGIGQRPAVEACLAAARAGLLTLRWEILCPNCRGGKAGTSSLSELPRGAHCPSCNIDYERDFERNVELAFSPAPAIRPLPQGGYCLSGPMGTPHVPVQLLLSPGERRTISIELPPGPYRLRTLHPGGHADVDHEGRAFPGLHVTPLGVEAMESGKPNEITFLNDTTLELAALIEDRRWTRDALTAPEVISLQAFRDLFAEATLRPGDEAAVGQVALLFSDLRGSTALYERVGDAAAFNIVRDHFAFLAAIVRDHDGAVVKTIGDAVMASFGDPVDAVQAALAMQARIAHFNRGHGGDRSDRRLVLKLGIHAGPSVMVSLNDRLDYFGSTVNMAARLQGQSQGGDIVLSEAVARDPAVKPLLASVPTRLEKVTLKGFDGPVDFVRILPAQVPK
jgi:class 3 adenylate cyclase